MVDHLSGRAEFYTAYTPYQPECSQGTLQALFEYQTAICRLTGLDVSNASLYDGGTALAEAAMMALRVTGRNRVIMDGAVNPFYREIVRTYLVNLAVEIVELPPVDGMLDRQSLAGNSTTARRGDRAEPELLRQRRRFQRPGGPGAQEWRAAVSAVYPVSLGLLKTPGDMGVDIAVGDGQSLGNPLSFGGPSFGFIAARKQYIRNLPGRIVGETVDREGRRGFVLTLQAREQHIKRHKATSNICSNQSLCALRGLIFLASLGKRGLAELAQLNHDKAEYAKGALAAVRGVTVLSGGPTFNEFTLRSRSGPPTWSLRCCNGDCRRRAARAYYPGKENSLVVTVTEKRTKEEIDLLARELEGALWN